ncbi:MAG: dephospho-CoA kinase [Candidatus Latescibacterota bacterium]|nr:MAG: dephospho-CoA kinase [Candidatus Latescibacterota bacterium]
MIVAVTGNMGSGKSEVAALFAAWGARRIDADRIGRGVWQNDPAVRARIVSALGPETAGPDGELDRARLGRAVFGDAVKRGAFDSIVQPILKEKIREEIRRARGVPDAVWVLDAALLFEWGMEGEVDRIVFVAAPADLRAERIAARHRLGREEAVARVASQGGDEEKRRRSHHVIVNEGSHRDLEERARAAWVEIAGRRPNG